MSKEEIRKACFDLVDDSINMCVPWYLMAAYAYYVEDDPILEDRDFDILSQKMLKDWDEITHIHKEYVTKDMLEAGTYIGDYPTRIKGALASVREAYR